MKRLWVSLLCLVSAAAAAAAEAPEDYAYVLPIEGITGEAVYRVTVPRVVYEATTFADLRDVRVFDGAGKIVPHAFRPVAGTGETRAPVSLPFYALRGPQGARVEDLDLSLENVAGRVSLKARSRYTVGGQWGLLGYLVDASRLTESLSGIALDWGPTVGNYFAVVRIEASEDLKLWRTLGEEAQLLSLSRGSQRIERRTVGYSPTRAKYLRIAWKDPARTVELKTVLGEIAEPGAAEERTWKRLAARQAADRSGDYLIDAGGLFPLDRLALRLPQDDSVVPVEIFSRATTSDAWNPVARSLAYRLKRGEIELVNGIVRIAPIPHRYWLLRADESGGGIGVDTFAVRVGWTPREIVFAARGAAPFILAYGKAKAMANAVPIETLVPDWRPDIGQKLRTATTGAPRGHDADVAAGPRVDTERASLWAALVVGLATLVWLSWRRRRESGRAEGGSS